MSSPKVGALQMGPKTQKGDFLEGGFNKLLSMSVIYKDYLSK
jgi:hypothetical protein